VSSRRVDGVAVTDTMDERPSITREFMAVARASSRVYVLRSDAET
jgi:hypothetical protein